MFNKDKAGEPQKGWIVKIIPAKNTAIIGESKDATTGAIFTMKHLDFTPEVGMEVEYKTITSYTGVTQQKKAVDVKPIS